MTEQILLNNGYKEFEIPPFDEYVDRFFQKKIKDDKGIKYFIDVYEYEFMDSCNYEFRLTTNKDKFWVSARLYSIDNMTLDEIEREIENIWKKCNFNYYELYEDESYDD